ncbi:hypothetical protein Tco_1540127 [Tanacetum coccineum]
MITTDNRIEDKKPLKIILPPTDILEIVLCVKDVDYITRDLAVSGLQQDRSPDQVLQKQQGHRKAYSEMSLLLFTLEFLP